MHRFIARQPILDTRSRTFGYELLFRSGPEILFNCEDPDQASSRVVDLLFGMQNLTEGRRAFINFTRNLIVREFATLLPKDQIIIEILEDVVPDSEVVAACRNLKAQGYMLALDDFTLREEIKPLIALADIIKIDFLATPPGLRRSIAKGMARTGIQLLAEKVETREQHREAMDYGYHYFQGYFFSKPELVQAREVPSCKMNYVLLLKAINRPDPDFTELESVIKREPSLTYRLLCYMNSAAFAFTSEVRSIRHALSLLGLAEVRKWTSLVALAGMGEDKPPAVVIAAITRARFCEALAPLAQLREQAMDLFLTGLLSLIDVILQRPMAEILNQVAVSQDVQSTLLDGGTHLRDVLELVIAYEKADWTRITDLSNGLRMDEAAVGDTYIQSVKWGHQVFHLKDRMPAHAHDSFG